MSGKSYGRIWVDSISGWERIRVVALGSWGSGKTVFLTSLGDHLMHPDESGFKLNGWKVVFDSDENERMQAKLKGQGRVKMFPFAEARGELAKGEWPGRTKDWSVLTIPFTLQREEERRTLPLLKKKKVAIRRRIRLEILDLPGERVADFAMLNRSYREWCNWMETAFGGQTGISRHYKSYQKRLSELGDGDQDREPAFAAYKDFLAGEYGDYSLSLTPSIVKLGLDGKLRKAPAKELFRKMLDETPIGVSQELQFIPLPGESFEKGGARGNWVAGFEKAYRAYKEAVLEPIADWCDEANSLVYLVDVLDLLARGPAAYNAEKRFAMQALGYFKLPKADGIVEKCWRALTYPFAFPLFTHVDSVCAVATQTDRVLSTQANNMVRLVERMLKGCLDTMGLAQGDCFCTSCAAVNTSGDNENTDRKAINARIETKDRTVEKGTYPVRDVPPEWPRKGEWAPGALSWPKTYPVVDDREDVPPAQKGLDAIVCKVLGLEAQANAAQAR